MTTERIKEIQNKTAYPESASVQQALLQVWNEVAQKYETFNTKENDTAKMVCGFFDYRIECDIHIPHRK